MSDKKDSLDLGAMMEESLDNIPDAPDFATPPAGDYRLGVKEAKVDKYTPKDETVEKQRIKMFYEVVSTVKLADDKEPPVPDGSLFSETFTATEEGLGYFKTRVKNIMNVEDLSGVSLRDMMASVAGQQFDARLSIRKTAKKGSPGEFYENINIRVIPPAA